MGLKNTKIITNETRLIKFKNGSRMICIGGIVTVMRALILTCNLGGGHNTAARAVAEHFSDIGVYSEVKDALGLVSDIPSKLTEKAYLTSTKGNAWAFGTIYKVGMELSSLKTFVKSPVYFANTLFGYDLYNYIINQDFDVVVCTHFFPSLTLTYLKTFYNLKAKCFLVATDYTMHPFMNETNVDGYFVPHEQVAEEFSGFGIPREKIYVTGIPVGKKYTVKKDKKQARQELGLPVDSKIYLIMSGSMGFGSSSEMVKQLFNVCTGDYKIIVICGSNKTAKNKIDEMFLENEKVLTIGFTQKVASYMDACDIIITKPGGLTTTEAAAKNKPLIHSKPIPGCENKNAEFFEKFGMSICEDDPFQLATIAEYIVNDERYQIKMMENQKKYINAFAARDICAKVKEIYEKKDETTDNIEKKENIIESKFKLLNRLLEDKKTN